jgi:hypothetical protein
MCVCSFYTCMTATVIMECVTVSMREHHCVCDDFSVNCDSDGHYDYAPGYSHIDCYIFTRHLFTFK